MEVLTVPKTDEVESVETEVDTEVEITEAEPQEEQYVVPEHYSVYIDFDGVIHSYTSGWLGADEIPDPPIVDGAGRSAIEFLNEVVEQYTVVIFTTRAKSPEGIEAIRQWLANYGFAGAEDCEITAVKGPGIIYIDDRAWRFRGIFPSLHTIRYALPWRVGDKVKPPVGETLRKKSASMAQLEAKLGRYRAELRQIKVAAQAVIDYYGVEDGPLPPVLTDLQGFLGSSRTTQ
jgi:hypothetical protein